MGGSFPTPDRLEKLARDIVEHWEARSEQMKKFIGIPGKGMIVCATRDICAALYEQIIAIKPDWHSDAIDRGKIKVVISGDASDKGLKAQHIRRPSANKTIQLRAKNHLQRPACPKPAVPTAHRHWPPGPVRRTPRRRPGQS